MSTQFKGRSTSAAVLLLLAAVAGGCRAELDDADSASDAITGYDPNGGAWATPSWPSRKTWYETSQGSHLIEYDVMLALERSGSELPFAQRANLEAMGFVYPMDGSGLTASARLPLGIVKDADAKEGREYVGFTCAACHTGELRTAKGKRVLIDGGQSFIDVEHFFGSLASALHDTTSDAAKNARFCNTLGGSADDCASRLDAASQRVDALQKRNVVALAGGSGRMDAIGRILNEVFAGQLGGETAKPVSVPVSIPYVWDAPRLSCVQTNCLSRNSFTRNVGEVLGVFGHIDLTDDGDGNRSLSTSAKASNLYDLEKSLESLESPKWNEKTFGTIDREKRTRGESLFGKQCASCHTEPYKNGASPDAFVAESGAGKTLALWKVTTTPYKTVGTDPAFIENHGARTVDKPELTALFDDLVRQSVAKQIHQDPDSLLTTAAFEVEKVKLAAQGIRNLDGSVSAIAMLGAVTSSLETTLLPELASSYGGNLETTKREVEFYRAPEGSLDFKSYRARPLNGIAFTAPFGHNGSWPTLRDMLEPESSRPTQFVVRPRSFDPDRVGLDTSPAKPGEKLFVFDTSKRGNLRGGHTYGTTMSASDKEALVEYLKSL